MFMGPKIEPKNESRKKETQPILKSKTSDIKYIKQNTIIEEKEWHILISGLN